MYTVYAARKCHKINFSYVFVSRSLSFSLVVVVVDDSQSYYTQCDQMIHITRIIQLVFYSLSRIVNNTKDLKYFKWLMPVV